MAPASVRNRASAGGGVPAAAVTMDPAGGGGGAYYQQQSGAALRKPSITVTRFNSEEGGIDDEADAESEIDAALPPRQPREQQVKWIRQNFFTTFTSQIYFSRRILSSSSPQERRSLPWEVEALAEVSQYSHS